MAAESSRNSAKRPLMEEDDEFSKKPPAKRVRFPKGKKVKSGDEVLEKENVEDGGVDLTNPQIAAKAAKERAKQRNQITAELFSEDTGGILNNLSAAEMRYEDNENFVDDGIQIEPFNLDKEREEGYFDAAGNFVEYVRENEIKDAWLDNIEVDPKYAALSSVATKEEDEVTELSSKDIGAMKRRIANVLEPGETVLQALRRLKGNSDRKAKMSAETKIVFDQLTEDAMKLMENGEYNVYHEKQEVFNREAEGYEKLARAKEGTSLHSGEGHSYLNGEGNLLSGGLDSGVVPARLLATDTGTSNQHLASAEASGNGADDYDMFADDEHDASKPSTDENKGVSQSSSGAINSSSEGGASQNDYVYDESSGYYYSSSLGYYYDPNTGLYCSAASGQWYSFNEETNTYEEVHEVASNAS
ncbi:CD2 antigen cytoplasmic tail-binding protein 2 [Cajanus cajan]|uniref:CD2 antigen cytoplasmic tail-binding protein 2 n=1 Tax=Cajanus cajan TaxID=3821 RepID=UPI00098D7ECA|nr:CD2 antigen cytoplasmic tail-binding protein 2 [Cajanus cajan]